MTIEHFAIAEIKNNWLYAQVDVEFPTKESLVGRDLYQVGVENKQYRILAAEMLDSAADSFTAEDIYLVDFHRLTVMFALLYSKQWSSDEDQQMMIEFLTQIIYSEPCELYIGFQNGEPVTTAILTRSNEQVLVSDITTTDANSDSKMSFVKSLLAKSAISVTNGDVVLEI